MDLVGILFNMKSLIISSGDVETNHQLQYTGSWDNDKLLVLYRNDILL